MSFESVLSSDQNFHMFVGYRMRVRVDDDRNCRVRVPYGPRGPSPFLLDTISSRRRTASPYACMKQRMYLQQRWQQYADEYNYNSS